MGQLMPVIRMVTSGRPKPLRPVGVTLGTPLPLQTVFTWPPAGFPPSATPCTMDHVTLLTLVPKPTSSINSFTKRPCTFQSVFPLAPLNFFGIVIGMYTTPVMLKTVLVPFQRPFGFWPKKLKSPAYIRHGLSMHGSSVPTGGTPGCAAPMYFCWPWAMPEQNITISSAVASVVDPDIFLLIVYLLALKLQLLVRQTTYSRSARTLEVSADNGASSA